MTSMRHNWGPGGMDRSGRPTGRHNTPGHSCMVATAVGIAWTVLAASAVRHLAAIVTDRTGK